MRLAAPPTPPSTHLPFWSLCFSGKTRTKDKYRVVYTDHQRLELEKEFHYSRYITIRRKSELAANLGLTERQVCVPPRSPQERYWESGLQGVRQIIDSVREENREVEFPDHGHTAQQKLSCCQILPTCSNSQYP